MPRPTDCPAAHVTYPPHTRSARIRCGLIDRDQEEGVYFDPMTDCTPYTSCSLWQRHKHNRWDHIKHEGSL